MTRRHSIVLFVCLVVAPGASSAGTLRFAVIGDYGDNRGGWEARVSRAVSAAAPDVIITTGDNNYPTGSARTIEANIARYYAPFIAKNASATRFFPSLGNHDWGNKAKNPRGADAYLSWFALPGNERYYEVARGPVRFFALDSDPNEPDGVTAASAQARWLRGALARAREPWKVVYFHHPPYSSGKKHGPSAWMRWPFTEWGASIVFSGHEHHYERLVVSRLPYIVNGASGAALYGFSRTNVASESRARIERHGAVVVDATDRTLRARFLAVSESGVATPADSLVLTR